MKLKLIILEEIKNGIFLSGFKNLYIKYDGKKENLKIIEKIL